MTRLFRQRLISKGGSICVAGEGPHVLIPHAPRLLEVGKQLQLELSQRAALRMRLRGLQPLGARGKARMHKGRAGRATPRMRLQRQGEQRKMHNGIA